MEESGSDKISNAWEVFVMMIEKSDYARFRNIPNTIRVREYAFGLLYDEISAVSFKIGISSFGASSRIIGERYPSF